MKVKFSHDTFQQELEKSIINHTEYKIENLDKISWEKLIEGVNNHFEGGYDFLSEQMYFIEVVDKYMGESGFDFNDNENTYYNRKEVKTFVPHKNQIKMNLGGLE